MHPWSRRRSTSVTAARRRCRRTTVRLVALVEPHPRPVQVLRSCRRRCRSPCPLPVGSSPAARRAAPPSAGAGADGAAAPNVCWISCCRGRSGLRPAGRARSATERERAGQDPEHQAGEAERRETHGKRPAEAVAGRTERSEQATDPVRAQPLGVLRPQLEVPRSLDRRELAGCGREAEELGVERRAFGCRCRPGPGRVRPPRRSHRDRPGRRRPAGHAGRDRRSWAVRASGFLTVGSPKMFPSEQAISHGTAPSGLPAGRGARGARDGCAT